MKILDFEQLVGGVPNAVVLLEGRRGIAEAEALAARDFGGGFGAAVSGPAVSIRQCGGGGPGVCRWRGEGGCAAVANRGAVCVAPQEKPPSGCGLLFAGGSVTGASRCGHSQDGGGEPESGEVVGSVERWRCACRQGDLSPARYDEGARALGGISKGGLRHFFHRSLGSDGRWHGAHDPCLPTGVRARGVPERLAALDVGAVPGRLRA
jgi:hypothetical protein